LLATFNIYNKKSKRKCLPLEGRDNRLMKKGEEEINVSNAETVKHHLQRYLLDVLFLTANLSGISIDICVGILLQGFLPAA
jgi:hypothetical protein